MHEAPIERAIRFGGLVLAHAAIIASALGEDELICPFAIVTKDDSRERIDFEAESQAEALEAGKASLAELKDRVDFWALGREGLLSRPGDSTKVDVLIVSAWTHGMAEPVVLIQRFRPATTGHFSLLGAVDFIIDGKDVTDEAADPLRDLVRIGVSLHPGSVPWESWLVH